jgi:hypothetical protein
MADVENMDIVAISEAVERKLQALAPTEQDVTKFETEQTSVATVLNNDITEFVNENPDLQDQVDKHKRKKFNIFKKLDANTTKDQADAREYKTKYEKEQIYYQRHQGTLEQYKVPKDSGFAKMWSIVAFDLFVTYVCFVLGFPIYLLKKTVELFAAMRRSIMWTVVIILVVVAVIVVIVLVVSELLQAARLPGVTS